MIIYLLLFVQSWAISSSDNCSDLDLARSCFVVELSEEKLSDFLDQTENNICETVQAYRASLYMRQAEFAVNPYKKWQFFKTGRDRLEQNISESPKNVEMRFIRYLTQKNIPSFLGYSKHLEQDKAYILAHLASSGLSRDFQETILVLLEK